jgi:arylsulfatase A-like enzyme
MLGGQGRISDTRCRRSGPHPSPVAWAVALVALLAVGAPVATAAPKAPKKRPNIVVVMTDDQDAASMKIMRRTQALIGRQGVTFENNFVSLPLCCPSRSTFLTGQYAHNHGVLFNNAPTGGYTRLDHTNTLPVWLQRAGYRTVHLGKYLNEYGELTPQDLVPPGWSRWYGLVDPSTYRYYNYTVNENGSVHTYGFPESDYPYGIGTYSTDLLTKRAVRFINRYGRARKPFFLSFAPIASHTTYSLAEGSPRAEGAPAVPAPRHRHVFEDAPLPRSPNFNEADVSDKPQLVFSMFPPLDQQQIDDLTAHYRGRYGSLLAVDEAVAKLVKALRRAGQLANTLFIYTSDNGFMLGEHRLPKFKYVAYEESIRVPLLMRGPGLPRHRTVADNAANIDLAPTILDFAGVQPGRAQDGISLLGVARRAQRSPRPTLLNPPRHILLESFPAPASAGGAPGFYNGIRTSRYKYVEWSYTPSELPVYIDGITGARELYDLEKDPYELQSVHASPAYKQVVAALHAELQALKTCAGASCHTTSSVP